MIFLMGVLHSTLSSAAPSLHWVWVTSYWILNIKMALVMSMFIQGLPLCYKFWTIQQYHTKVLFLGVKTSLSWNSNSFHWIKTTLGLLLCVYGTIHRSQLRSHSLSKMLMSPQWEQIVNRKEERVKVRSNIIRDMDLWNVCRENSIDALEMDFFA